MDSRTLLDYASFRLTPTRTRCDLVIFAGEKKEKIASGLLEPFVSHLKSAEDQISNGGYSITLQPDDSEDYSWFSKATLERFVKFVSTPEVLERFVTIEREINQIESSIQSNDQIKGTPELQGNASSSYGDPKTPLAPFKSKVQSTSDIESEEKPKVRLQRVLESRKAMLKKEQAMAYARALVTGFGIDCLYDLVSFSDAFGAKRLREACINFMELCNKKNDDKIWMDEVAAMQVSYMAENNGQGSIDTSQENGLSMEFNQQQTQAAAQLPPWAHHFPQHMHTNQSPIFRPYQNYIFPVDPSHYPWSTNFHDSRTPRDKETKDGQKPRKKKEEKHVNTKESDGNSSDERGKRTNSKKKTRSSSGRKVIIRNVNYIASSRSGNNSIDSGSDSSNEDERVNDYLLKDQVEESGGSLKIRHEINETTLDSEEGNKDGNWDIFQNLLMRGPDSNATGTGSKSIDIQEEYSSQKAYRDETLSSLDTKSGYNLQTAHFSTDPSVFKSNILVNPGENTEDNQNIDQIATVDNNGKIIKDVILDDSFVVQTRVSEDLKMMLGHDSIAEQGVLSSWNNEMDYKNDVVLLVETVGSRVEDEMNDSVDDATRIRNGKVRENGDCKEVARKMSGKELKAKGPNGSLGRSKSDFPFIWSKLSTPGSTIIRSKSEKEEEKRKRTEELLTTRQKRIAERSLAKGTVNPKTSKISPKENNPKNKNSDSSSKPKLYLPIDQDKKSHKTVMRSSTIDRLATARTTNTTSSIGPKKLGHNKKTTPKAQPSSSLKKTKGAQEQKKGTNTNNSKIISSEKSEKIQIKNVLIEHPDSVKVMIRKDDTFEKKSIQVISDKDLLRSSEDINVHDHQNGVTSQITVDPTVGNDSKSNVSNAGERKKITFSPEISTPPETNESIHARKKWNNGESSPLIPKGFRRLLFFGHKT